MKPVACLSFFLVEGRPELEEIRSLGVEVVIAPYLEEQIRRNARSRTPLDELRATAAPLSEEQRRALARAEILLALDVPVDLGALAPNLRWAHVAGAGVEHLAGAGLARRNVVVTNSSGIAATSIAEFVIGSLLAIWKRFEEIREHQRARQWVPTFGRTFAGSVIGIVGVGAIGAAVAARAKALGARVLGIRRSGAPVPEVDEMFRPDRLHDVLSRCDAVVVAAPGGDETDRLIDREAIAAMRPGAVFCNVARGSLVDEAALTEALRAGRLKAAILDVFEREPLPPESPLWELPNCTISAHCSVSIERYAEDVLALFLENLRRYLSAEPLRNVVAAPD